MKPHVFHPEAEQEYTEAARYYARISPELGWRFFDEIERLIQDVRHQPDCFRVFDPPARRHFSDVFPYAVIYLVLAETFLPRYSRCYRILSVPNVVFVPSAFRHGYRAEDFYQVLAGRYLKVRSGKGLQAVYEILGQNLAGDYLHIVYRILHDGRCRIFHIDRMNETLKRRFRRLRP